MERVEFDLRALRDIGWVYWDPIGLKEDRDSADDEYDTYLIRAAGMLWRGDAEGQVVDYLCTIETKWMGLAPPNHEAAAATVEALKTYVRALRSGD